MKGNSKFRMAFKLAFLGLLLLGAFVIWHVLPQNAPAQETAVLVEDSSIPLDAPSQELPVTEVAAKTMLAEYYLTGEAALLKKAQTLYPMDVDVILASCVEARSPDSVYLNLLEVMEPENALPNLLRAGMYAEHDKERFVEEFKKAVNKSEIHTGIQSRRAEMVKVLKARGENGIPMEVLRRAEQNYQHHFTKVYATLANNYFLLGDAMTSDDSAMKFVSQLRKNSENPYSNGLVADQLELNLLKKFEAQTGSGDSQRKEILVQRMRDDFRAVEKATALLFSPSLQATTRFKFLEVMSSQGELEAVKWLLNQ